MLKFLENPLVSIYNDFIIYSFPKGFKRRYLSNTIEMRNGCNIVKHKSNVINKYFFYLCIPERTIKNSDIISCSSRSEKKYRMDSFDII